MPTLLGRNIWYDGYPSARPSLSSYPFPTTFGGATLLGAYPFPTTFGRPQLLGEGINWTAAWPKIAGILAITSAAVSGYHGFKRNESIWGGILWFALGALFPVITPIAAVALPPGFAKKK
jgi:hypothetical protein